MIKYNAKPDYDTGEKIMALSDGTFVRCDSGYTYKSIRSRLEVYVRVQDSKRRAPSTARRRH